MITNINIPEVIPNTSSDKESKPFKLPQSPKMVDIYLPDNGHFGTLSITGGIVVTLLTNSKNQVYLSFNEVKVPSKTLFVDDRIHIINHHNSNYHCNKYKYKCNKKKYLLRDININGISEETINKEVNKTVSQSNNNYTTVSTSSIPNKQIEELKKQLAEYKTKAEKIQKDLSGITIELTNITNELQRKTDELEDTKNTLNEKEEALRQAESDAAAALEEAVNKAKQDAETEKQQAVAAAVDNFKAEEAKYTTINCLAIASKTSDSYTVNYILMCGNCKVIISPANDLTHTGKVNDKYFYTASDIWNKLGKTKCNTTDCDKKFRQDKINITKQSFSYLNVSSTPRKLYCGTCNKDMKMFDNNISLDDVKAIANTYHDSNCTCKSLHYGIEEFIAVYEVEIEDEE